ncbi:MAG: caspase family protein, partial [Chloroflexi bacterium]|nr:caspase family protein [Chloroflexota bacterium]
MTTDRATVVGIDRYPAAFQSLTNALADARAIADLLARDYGFQPWPPGAPVLTNGAAALVPLQDAIASALYSGADRWLFYFAGHGAVIDGIGYLVPADGRFKDPTTYLPLPWLLDVCRASAVDQIAIILDACYSGRALVRGEALDDLSPTVDYRRVRQIVSAGNPRQPVLDGGAGGHSVFTRSVLDALEGRAGVHEPDGTVRFPRLLDHLALDVPARLWASGASPSEQQPLGGYFQGNTQRRTFDLTPTTPRLPPALVQDTRSEDPTRRQDALRRLARVAGEQPALTDPVVDLGIRHLRPDPT